MPTEIVLRSPVEYALIEDGIHSFCFHHPTHEAVDFWLEKSATIARSMTAEDTMRSLVVLMIDEPPPLSYGFVQSREVLQTLTIRPYSCIAVLHRSSFVPSFANAFIRLLGSPKDHVRFFPIDERERAVAWLLAAQV